MLGFLKKLLTYKQSVIVVVVLVCTLIGGSLTYKHKLEEIVLSSSKQNILVSSANELNNVNQKLDDIKNFLKIAAKSLSANSYVGGVHTDSVMEGIREVFGYLNIGIVDIDGNSLYGYKLAPSVFKKLMISIRSDVSLIYVKTPNSNHYDIIMAVPLNQGDYIKNFLFVQISEVELIKLFVGDRRSSQLDNHGMSFLVNSMRNVVAINHSIDDRLLPKESVAFIRGWLEEKKIETLETQNNFSEVDFLNAGQDEIFVYQSKKYPKHYVSILPTKFQGWYYFSLIPASIVDSKISAIMVMFVVFILSIVLVVLLLLSYYEYTVNMNRNSIHYLAYVDEYTQLPNKSSLRKNFKHMVKMVESGHRIFVVKMIISNYEWVSRLYGLELAEKFELKVARYFLELDDEHVFASRVQGFFVLIMAAHKEEDIRETLLHMFDNFNSIPNVDIKSVFCCGVAEFDAKRLAPTEEQLDYCIDNCAIAMTAWRAKNKNRSEGITYTHKDSIYIYNEKFRDEIRANNVLEQELEPALAAGEFLVYLQPKYDLKTNALAGAEALIRWNYKGTGILPPYKFIPVFESNGSIALIDSYVFRQSLRILRRWEQAGKRLVPISVNLSQVQFLNPNLVAELKQEVEGYRDLLKYVDIEITESATVDDSSHVIEVLRQLKDIGFKLSMDDFGTGYSSLSNLSVMPFDTVKLDKSFVDRMKPTDRKSMLIIKDIILIAKHFNIHTLVEGVETLQQKNLLRDLGCEYCQGYYYSKPIPVKEFEEILFEDKIFEDRG